MVGFQPLETTGNPLTHGCTCSFHRRASGSFSPTQADSSAELMNEDVFLLLKLCRTLKVIVITRYLNFARQPLYFRPIFPLGLFID